MLYTTDPDALGDLFPDEPAFRARQVREWLYGHPVLDAASMTNLPAGMRDTIAEGLWPFTVETRQEADGGATVKWLFRAADGAAGSCPARARCRRDGGSTSHCPASRARSPAGATTVPR